MNEIIKVRKIEHKYLIFYNVIKFLYRAGVAWIII